MKKNQAIILFALLGFAVCAPSKASADQFLFNTDFETQPVGADSATNTFPIWLEGAGSDGTSVVTAPVPISGSYSAMVTKVLNGSLNQPITNTAGWLADWVYDTDFACSAPGGGAARSFQLGLYHAATANLNLRVIDVEPNGVGDVQVYNGTAFVTIITNLVTFSSSNTNLAVNHLHIVGHYYATNAPNYDVTVTSSTGLSNTVSNLKYWQAGAPPSNATTHLTQIRFDSANLVAGSFEVVDNVSISVATVTSTSVYIASQPSPSVATAYDGYNGALSFSALVGGGTPISYQWLLNGTNVPGANTNILTLTNITASSAGSYSLFVSNATSTAISSNAVLTVLEPNNTAQMTNIWTLSPGTSPFLTTSNTERSLAFNPATSNLLLATRYSSPTDSIAVLDAPTGALKYYMNMSGVPLDTVAPTIGISQIGVGDDGAVYGGAVTENAGSASNPYQLWQWANDGSSTTAVNLFAGDPGYSTTAANLRWGDSMAVRGSGIGTQILIAPATGTNVAFFVTDDGADFYPVIVGVSGVVGGYGRTGLAFGPGTNTFWAKTGGDSLYLIRFDLSTGTGVIVSNYGVTSVPATLRSIGTSTNGKWLAGISSENPDNVRLYDVSNLTNGPVLADQELFNTSYSNTTIPGGVGAVSFGGNYMFALDENNGIKAFLLNTNTTTVLAPFSITNFQNVSGTGLVLTWQSVAGHSYQVQSTPVLTGNGWTNNGTPVTASGTFTSWTNPVSGSTQFYRVQGN